MTEGWGKYYEYTENKPPAKLLEHALTYARVGPALDLGAGALVDSEYLLRQGFIVTAIDINETSQKLGRGLMEKYPGLFDFKQESFDTQIYLTNTYTLVNAQFSLPYANPDRFNEMFDGIKRSLKSGGVFVGQFLGDRDQWQHKPGVVVHTKEQITKLLEGLTIIQIDEIEQDKKRASGEIKHWHVFHVIARKV